MRIPLMNAALASALVLGASAAFGAGAHRGYANPDLLMEAGELMAHMEGPGDEPMIIVDVRTRDAYLAGHVPGAVHLGPEAVTAPDAPVGSALRPVEELVDILEALGVSANSHLVFYDESHGLHAARMFWVAEYLGLQAVSVLDGGLPQWVSNGGTLSTDEQTAPKMGQFSPAVVPRRFASADWILEHRDDPQVAVIDVRSSEAFSKGHIPWATNIPWKGSLTEDGTIANGPELAAHFARHGIQPETSVVVHCEVGLASSHSYLTLRLIGQPRVRTYHRSWAEWGGQTDLPRSAGGEG